MAHDDAYGRARDIVSNYSDELTICLLVFILCLVLPLATTVRASDVLQYFYSWSFLLSYWMYR